MLSAPPNPLAEHVWRARYRTRREDGTAERSLDETLARVAKALAAAERDPEAWQPRFASILDEFRFLPGGRILAGAGAVNSTSLLNCFVMGPVEDTRAGVLRAVGEGIETLSRGGGTSRRSHPQARAGWQAISPASARWDSCG
jgi:ribonucleoside-diphosphate reductase alpha chain